MDGFVSVDIEKAIEYKLKCEEYVEEFEKIRTEFENINRTLCASWKGYGGDAYKKDADNILEKIGDFKICMQMMNTGLDEVIKHYMDMDVALEEMNKSYGA